MADVRTEETTTSWSTASGLLWIALNKVGTWTLIQVELLPHTVRSTLTQLDVLYKKKKKMNLHVLILLIFVHLYRFVLGLFVCLLFFVVVVQLWSVLKWRCFRSPCVSALFLLSRLVFLTSKKWIFIQQPEHQADFVKLVVEQLDTSVWHQTVSQRRFVYSKY